MTVMLTLVKSSHLQDFKFRRHFQWSARPDPHQPPSVRMHTIFICEDFCDQVNVIPSNITATPSQPTFQLSNLSYKQVALDLFLSLHGLRISSPTRPVACFNEPNIVMHLAISTLQKLYGCILYNFLLLFHRSKFISSLNVQNQSTPSRQHTLHLHTEQTGET
jgi:hypothetical protein